MTTFAALVLLAACGEEPAIAPDAADSAATADVPGYGVFEDAPAARSKGEQRLGVNDLTRGGVLGNSLPGNWRPFSADSPWNTPIAADAPTHPDNDVILSFMRSEQDHVALTRSYTIPVWVVDSSLLEPVIVRSDKIHDFWDADRDGWSDVGVPINQSMWWEPTSDGHICIIDPALDLAWEMSRFGWLDDDTPTCTTFNIWDLDDVGYGNPNEGYRWGTRGGRGSGFPIIAGLVRPEEIEAGEIRHALAFTFSKNRRADDGESDIFLWPPACRSDGDHVGVQYPIEGMLFQLDPSLDENDFDDWGLTEEARIMARALQTYGMYLCDRGGDMKIMMQLLSDKPNKHRQMWEERAPGLYRSIENIPTSAFRVVYTGEPTIKD